MAGEPGVSTCYVVDEERVVVVRWGGVRVWVKAFEAFLKFHLSRWFHLRVETAIVRTRV